MTSAVRHQEIFAAWWKDVYPWRATVRTLFVVHMAKITWLAEYEDDWDPMTREQFDRKFGQFVHHEWKRVYRADYNIKFDRDWRVLDGWGRPLRIEREKFAIDFYSLGKNGLDESGEGDDMAGW